MRWCFLFAQKHPGILDITVIEARDIKPMDVNGMGGTKLPMELCLGKDAAAEGSYWSYVEPACKRPTL